MNTDVRIKTVEFVLGMALTSSVMAYEVSTHAWMTNEAYLRSDLAQTGAGSLRERLGFDRLNTGSVFDSLLVPVGGSDGSCPDIASGNNPLHCYYDNISTDTASFFRRDPYSEFEKGLLKGLARAQILRDSEGAAIPPGAGQIQDSPLISGVAFGLGGWLMRGAIREDDLSFPSKKDYDSDPRGDIFRVFNHFWDPVHNLGMSAVSGCPPLAPGQVCTTAIQWATGLQDPLGAAQTEDGSRRQHFSYKDATNNYWWALTRQRSRESGGSSFTKADDSRERTFRWATTLRSLGDTVHLLQDMAQPQHTRLDPHSPLQPPDRQLYEAYTDARVLKLKSDNYAWDSPLRTLTNDAPQPAQFPVVSAGCYPTPAFSLVRKFYSSQAGGDAVATRMGMADYSNRDFFTEGTLPNNTAGTPVYDDPPRQIFDASGNLVNGYTRVKESTHLTLLMGANVAVQVVDYALLHDAPDPVPHSGCQDDLPAAYGGKASLATEGLLYRFGTLSPGTPPDGISHTVAPENLIHMADLLIPRAIAYSTGLINFFFRGHLEVVAPNDKIVGVLNQGTPHLMAGGYPVRTDAQGGILGFEKIRLKVRNSTVPIQQVTGGAAVVQTSGGAGAQLVAVARYHRNSCYKPDLSGERVQSYVPPPLLGIAEPACAAGEVVRTDYQEISTSAPLSLVTGELDVAAGAEVEKVFDFSADPIPANATDLFLQVAYRGPLGDDADGVAVGTLDVREPTFASFWNNTDYWWNGGSWFPHSTAYPADGAKDFWACAGGAPVKLVFFYQGATGAPALIDPIAGSNQAGMVRLGFIFPPPDPAIPLQHKNVRGVPVAYSIPGIPQIPMQSISTPAVFRQANKERIDASTLAAPFETCASGLPSTPEYWCFDTVQKRRSQIMGAPMQPLYLEPTGTGTIPADVDEAGQPTLAGVIPLASGTIRFDTDATLSACPAQPTSAEQPVDAEALRHLELLEEARDIGIDDVQG